MLELTGTWEGEYSINYGTEQEPDVEYFEFRMDLVEKKGIIEGTCEDISLESIKSSIKGFVEGGFINFVKKYDHLLYEDGDRKYYIDESDEHPDISYEGNYNENEKSFGGFWTMEVDEEKIRLTEDYNVETREGAWYMKKVA